MPGHVLEAFCHVIKIECKGDTNYEKRAYDSYIKEAFRQQQEIGVHMMLRDFLAKGWMAAIEAAGSPNPEHQMNILQCMIWDTIMDPLWQDHNGIKHRKDNACDAEDYHWLTARIVWYVDHRHELMDHHAQFLAEIDLTRLSRTRR